MNQLLLIVSIAGSRVALPAAAVESVVELEALIPVPRAPAHIAGSESRPVLSVTSASFRPCPSAPSRFSRGTRTPLNRSSPFSMPR